ncbi:hypothetical protein BDZ94DRAFT_870248 [Collybia nuda]|uniref:Uncharacterized protein n=1 Tax=Collybia nuda TaxID=64659 RepID=A0A9P6CCR0_9AGAR|nr:hypothetical protein BDZ94DRAFT_870248 [Collybia nuda]
MQLSHFCHSLAITLSKKYSPRAGPNYYAPPPPILIIPMGLFFPNLNLFFQWYRRKFLSVGNR